MEKKVLFAATLFSHLAAFHKPFIKWFQEKGYEVHAVGNPNYGRRNELEKIGVVCHDISFERTPFSFKNKEAAYRLKQLFIEQNYSIIHVHTPVAAFIVRYLAKKYSNAKVIYTTHGFHFYRGAPPVNWLLYYPAEKLASRWTDALIVINEEDYKLGKRLGFQPNENLYYVKGVGVNTKEFSSELNRNNIMKELELKVEDIIIICVAELNNNKNHMFLLKIWRYIEHSYPNVKLFLVGDGENFSIIKNKIQNLGLSNVKLLGFRSDVREILACSDIVTLVSKREGLPKAIMEAMASGKPVIASDIRGNRDLVVHGETGFLIPLANVENGVSSFKKLIEDRSLRESMGRKGLEKIIDYDIEKVLNQMGDIYSGFIQEN